jgi:hypothetical protein
MQSVLPIDATRHWIWHLFGLFALLGLVTAFVAAVRGASKWVALPLLVALSIFTLVGFMEALSV